MLIESVGGNAEAQPAGRHPLARADPAGLRVLRRCAPASPGIMRVQRVRRRRQQRRPVDRARRDPRRRHRRHGADRRPLLLAGTVLGALVIQTLTTTIYAIGIPPETTLLFKAIVVIVVCLLQSPAFRAKVFGADAATRPPAPAPDRRAARSEVPGMTTADDLPRTASRATGRRPVRPGARHPRAASRDVLDRGRCGTGRSAAPR